MTKECGMQRVTQGMVGVALGLSLLGLVGGAGAQSAPPPQPIPPIQVAAEPPPCQDFKLAVPASDTVVLKECRMSDGRLCLVGASLAGTPLVCDLVLPAAGLPDKYYEAPERPAPQK
jgi:hypothetical protein